MSVTDQPQAEPTPGGLVGKVLEGAKNAAGSAVGSKSARGPKSWPDDLPPSQREAIQFRSAEHDPVYQAAREVVQALIETRWSLQAAAVVVALRRLCDTVAGNDA
jgi:hypothetical protein